MDNIFLYATVEAILFYSTKKHIMSDLYVYFNRFIINKKNY